MTEVFKGTRVDNLFAFIYFHRKKHSILQVSLLSFYVQCNLLERGIGKELLCCDSHAPSSIASIKRGSVGCSVVLLFAPFFRCRMIVSWEVRPTGYLIHGRRKQRAVLQSLEISPWLTARQKAIV